MSIQFRIMAQLTDKSLIKSDPAYVSEIAKALQEAGMDSDEASALRYCIEEIRSTFAELKNGNKRWLTILVNGSEISIMGSSLAVVVIELKSDEENRYKIPTDWVSFNGVELKLVKG